MQFSFCPTCGIALQPAPGPHQPQTCASCGAIHYRNAKPCAGMVVERHGRVLLARRALEPHKGAWDLPGGFLREDEHPEEGARREILEETGLRVRVLGLLGIYMDRYGSGESAPWILNIYYHAEPLDDADPQPADDVSSLAWFAPEELPARMAFPHENQVLADWRARRARR